jgi:type VI secretion system protein ImpJ
LQPIIQSIEKIAKMSSREDLPIRVARALPGIKLAHLPLPPQELPRRSDSLYFEINRHSDLWDHLVKGHNMALYWDEAPEDVQVELMITGRA